MVKSVDSNNSNNVEKPAEDKAVKLIELLKQVNQNAAEPVRVKDSTGKATYSLAGRNLSSEVTAVAFRGVGGVWGASLQFASRSLAAMTPMLPIAAIPGTRATKPGPFDKRAAAIRVSFKNDQGFLYPRVVQQILSYLKLADKISDEEAFKGAEALRQLFNDKDPDVRVTAIVAYLHLAEIKKNFSPEERIAGYHAFLIMAGDDKANPIGINFAELGLEVLIDFHREGWIEPNDSLAYAKVLVKELKNPKPLVRAAAATMLGELPTPSDKKDLDEFRSIMLELLQHPDPAIRAFFEQELAEDLIKA